MQKINLLPPSRRPAAPTPPKLILTLYVGVALTFSLLFWALFLHFYQVPPLEKEIVTIQEERNKLKRDVDYYDRLVAENAAVEKRASIVDDLKSRRVRWAKRLDGLWDVIDSSRTTWISKFSVDEIERKDVSSKKRRRRKSQKEKEYLPKINLRVRSSSFVDEPKIFDMTAESLAGEFIDHLKTNSELMQGFEVRPPTAWQINDKEWRRTRHLTIDYDLELRALPYNTKTRLREALP